MSAVVASSLAALLVEDPRTVGETLHHQLLALDLGSVVGPPPVVGDRPGDGVGSDGVGSGGVGSDGAGSDIVRRVAEGLAAFLTMPLGDFVAVAWQHQPAVLHACRQTEGRPGATRRIDVGDHTVECLQRPAVELDVAGARTRVLDVAVTVALSLDRIVVDVETGRVAAVGAGQGSSSAELTVALPGGRPRRLFARETAALLLPAYRCPRPAAAAAPRPTPVGAAAGGQGGAGIPGAHWGRLST